jgi:hypothetical protein
LPYDDTDIIWKTYQYYITQIPFHLLFFNSDGMPTFSWSTTKKSPSGIPVLYITIPNKDPDMAFFSYSSLSNHQGLNLDCILEGIVILYRYLKDIL